MENIEQDEKLKAIYEEIEVPLIPVMSRIERTGVFVDDMLLSAQSQEIAVRLDELEQKNTRLPSKSSSMNSPGNSCKRFCLRKWVCLLSKKTPSGSPSTNDIAGTGARLPAT